MSPTTSVTGNGLNVLARFEDAGYRLWLCGKEIRAEGPGPPSEELRALVADNRDILRAAVLLSDPPAWLARLFDLYWSGHETPVRLTTPKSVGGQEQLDLEDVEPHDTDVPYPDNLKGGKTEIYMVRLSLKNICAAVAAEIGAPVLEWECLLAEVEDAIGAWESERQEVQDIG